MRRIEAEKALAGLLIALDARVEPMEYKDKANAIITFLEEEIGMEPPGRIDETIWDRANQDYAVFNEWEPEDESR